MAGREGAEGNASIEQKTQYEFCCREQREKKFRRHATLFTVAAGWLATSLLLLLSLTHFQKFVCATINHAAIKYSHGYTDFPCSWACIYIQLIESGWMEYEDAMRQLEQALQT